MLCWKALAVFKEYFFLSGLILQTYVLKTLWGVNETHSKTRLALCLYCAHAYCLHSYSTFLYLHNLIIKKSFCMTNKGTQDKYFTVFFLFLLEWELLLCTIVDRNKCYRNYKYTLAPSGDIQYWPYYVTLIIIQCSSQPSVPFINQYKVSSTCAVQSICNQNAI